MNRAGRPRFSWTRVTLGHSGRECGLVAVGVTMRRARVLLVVAVPVLLLASGIAFVLVRAQRGLERARMVAEERGRVGFELRRLSGAGAGAGTGTRLLGVGFEPVASAAGFVSAAFFLGNLYVAGPAGLYVYGAGGGVGSDGSAGVGGTAPLVHTYRVGMDLPAAPLGAMAVGTLRGESEPVLMIATAGEGVLLFTAGAGMGSGAGGGGSFRQLRPEAPEMRDVTGLLPLATGDLLVGTRRAGLLVYSGATLGGFRAETADVPVTALAEDGAGGFWVGTRDRGALHWSGGTMERVDAAAGLPDDQVESIVVRSGDVFVGTPVGVAEVRDGRVVRRLAEGSFARALAVTADAKALAVGTMEEGVLDVPLGAGGARRGIPLIGGLGRAVAEGAVAGLVGLDGNLYEVLQDGVRRRTASGGWETVVEAPPAALTDGNISALAFAGDGRLWVGYFDHGIDVLGVDALTGTAPGGGADSTGAAGGRKGSVARQQTEHIEDDAVFCVNRLLAERRNGNGNGQGTMVAATANGLVLFDAEGRERQVLTRRDGLISDHVTDVAATGRGLALATPAGLTFVDAEGTQSLYGFEGLVNNHVYTIGVQPDGDEILAGTLGGVSLLASEEVRRNLTVANSGLRHNWVTAVVPMEDGGWMVGTYGAGVMRLDKQGQFAPMEGATGEMVINPNAMLATTEHVFAGSLGQGLWAYTRATGRWKQMTDGLPSENVTAMVERDGEIYVGTENGLVRIAERAVDAAGAR